MTVEEYKIAEELRKMQAELNNTLRRAYELKLEADIQTHTMRALGSSEETYIEIRILKPL